MVQLVQIAIELLMQILDEQTLHVVGHGIVVLGFVIDLIADHCRMVGNMGDQLADHALAVEAVGGVDDVHDLAGAVLAFTVRGNGEHAWIELDQPARHCVGWSADDDVDASALCRIERAVHISEVEYTRLRFAGAPRGFGNADDVQSRFLHHPHVFIDAVDAFHHEVFVVICGTEKNVICLVTTHGSPIVFIDLLLVTICSYV